MKKKALIAMSGGVDSSVAAYLMKQQGYDCTGITMKLFENQDIGIGSDKTCCSLEDAEDARRVASSLDIPFYVSNFTPYFKEAVIDRFIKAYQNGATPNPCIDCNRKMKYDKLFSRAAQLDMDYIVTGHYARVEYDTEAGRWLLKKALDVSKDQSYVLYFLTQTQLAHTMFPLGGLHKSETREIAVREGFVNADKRDSQDICFVRDGDYAGFIETYTGKLSESGDFIDTHGNVLGRHKGLIRYTVGQRKGLEISMNRPMYVKSKDAIKNTVTICDEHELFTSSLDADDINLITYESIETPLRVKAKIRYSQPEQWATAIQTSQDTLHIEFDEPQRAISKGQAVVLYDGDTVVAGGTIT